MGETPEIHQLPNPSQENNNNPFKDIPTQVSGEEKLLTQNSSETNATLEGIHSGENITNLIHQGNTEEEGIHEENARQTNVEQERLLLQNGCDASELTHNPNFENLPEVITLHPNFLTSARFLRAVTDYDVGYLESLGFTKKQIKKIFLPNRKKEVGKYVTTDNGNLEIPLSNLQTTPLELQLDIGTKDQILGEHRRATMHAIFNQFLTGAKQNNRSGGTHTHPRTYGLHPMQLVHKDMYALLRGVHDTNPPSSTDIATTATLAKGGVEVVIAYNKIYVLVKTAQSIALDEAQTAQFTKISNDRFQTDISTLLLQKGRYLGKNMGKKFRDIFVGKKTAQDTTRLQDVTIEDIDNRLMKGVKEECDSLNIGLYEAAWNPQKSQTEPLALKKV